jgi:hypothetical protein
VGSVNHLRAVYTSTLNWGCLFENKVYDLSPFSTGSGWEEAPSEESMHPDI